MADFRRSRNEESSKARHHFRVNFSAGLPYGRLGDLAVVRCPLDRSACVALLLSDRLVHDIVTVKNRSSFMAADGHGDPFRHASPYHITDCSPAEVMEDAARILCFQHCIVRTYGHSRVVYSISQMKIGPAHTQHKPLPMLYENLPIGSPSWWKTQAVRHHAILDFHLALEPCGARSIPRVRRLA